ncbi:MULTISPECIES: acyltransferase [unclassified Mycobacterium]|uniref:acyltransferase family protein n=1 Tax=unclassified Mycobacterium TaxID=2642494 RepID=UPI0029C68B98|nr:MULTISPECIES: acyltransferase [unclassified Mycobacterium]
MRSGEIRALTGLRIFAAVWVVVFHYRIMLAAVAPDLTSALWPILYNGAQGVDLFFILSGFVLTWNYIEKMGPAWSTRSTLRFLWLRLARVWPVYLVTMHLAALWIIFTLNVGHVPADNVNQLTAANYIRQLFLVQLWVQPFFDGTSWDGPAWSISAEWLAYLMFGVLILVIFRVAHATRARGLMLMAVAVTLPPVMLMLGTGFFYTPWSWLPRIILQFTAGALACVAVRKLDPSERTRKAAGVLSLVLVGVIVGLLYWFDAHPLPDVIGSAGVVDLLFAPFVIVLAIGAGSLPALLSTRLVVYLGQVSFSLYMVHEMVHLCWDWAYAQFGLTLTTGFTGKLIVLGLFAAALGLAMLLYHVVEEPARHWMRRMVDVPEKPVTEHVAPPADPLAEEPEDNLQHIDGPRVAKTRTARAG